MQPDTTFIVPIREKKAEAVARMQMMNIFWPIINSFRGGKMQYYESSLGAGFFLTPAMKTAVQQFEQGGKRMVYAVLRNMTEFGECWNMLYVSDERSEWEQDRKDLKRGYPIAYVYNASCPEFSETGTIGVRQNRAGTLSRTA